MTTVDLVRVNLNLRWFDALGRCRDCPRPATGILRGSHNESYGCFCDRCAKKRLKEVDKARERLGIK